MGENISEESESASPNRGAFMTFLIFFTIFFCSYVFSKEPFEFYFHYIIFGFFFPFFVLRFGFPIMPFQILALPLLFGIFQVYAGNNDIALFVKIFMGVFLSSSFYYYVMQVFELDVDKLFKLYLKGAYYTTLIGFFQIFCFLIKFTPGYNYTWLFNKWAFVTSDAGLPRMNSIFPEPSQYAIVVAPAMFVAINNIISKREYFFKQYESGLIILGVILSTSSVGVIALFLSAIFITINHGKFINVVFALVLMVVMANVFYIYSHEFQSRVNSAYGLWVEDTFTIENVNNSSFVLFNNYHVALENFKQHPLFGTGLGSHPYAFDIYSYTLSTDIIDFNNNKADANSMFLRIMSETGLIGIFFIFFIIFKFFVKRDFEHLENNNWIISSAVLVLIICFLIRQGNYFINGFPFFMWMYYYTFKVNKNELEANKYDK